MDRRRIISCRNCTFSAHDHIHNDLPQTPESIAKWDRFQESRLTEIHNQVRPHCHAPEFTYAPSDGDCYSPFTMAPPDGEMNRILDTL